MVAGTLDWLYQGADLCTIVPCNNCVVGGTGELLWLEPHLVIPSLHTLTRVEGGIMGPVEGYLTEWVSAPLPWCRNLAYCSPLMFLPAVWHAAPCCSVQIRPVG
jgi:hypothetical protein